MIAQVKPVKPNEVKEYVQKSRLNRVVRRVNELLAHSIGGTNTKVNLDTNDYMDSTQVEKIISLYQNAGWNVTFTSFWDGCSDGVLTFEKPNN
jgi:molybdenum cofactor biosynthesis enzyme MoaA